MFLLQEGLITRSRTIASSNRPGSEYSVSIILTLSKFACDKATKKNLLQSIGLGVVVVVDVFK